jgi:hypothetical protein
LNPSVLEGWKHPCFRDCKRDSIFGPDEGPQRLLHFSDQGKGFANKRAPVLSLRENIVRLHYSPAIILAAMAGKRAADVESRVIVSNFLARGYVADGDLEIKPRIQTVRIAGMVDKARVIPTEDQVSVAVHERILVEQPLENRREKSGLRRRKQLIQLVSNPGNGSTRNELPRHNSITDNVVYVLQFNVWMDHLSDERCVIETNYKASRYVPCPFLLVVKGY